jgi:hypothetical protein
LQLGSSRALWWVHESPGEGARARGPARLRTELGVATLTAPARRSARDHGGLLGGPGRRAASPIVQHPAPRAAP